MKKYFLITGLPRSRTAWLSALFNTHEDVVCFHEPTNKFGNWDAIKKYTDSLNYKYIGFSDSTLSLYADFISKHFNDYRLIVIERDEKDVIKSLSDFLFISKQESENLLSLIRLDDLKKSSHHYATIKYSDLNNNNAIKTLWEYCIPSLKFDKIKTELFQNLLINQHKEKIISEIGIENQSILNDN